MSRYIFPFIVFIFSNLNAQSQSEKINAADKTSFQVSAPWNAAYDIRSDIAMVYGMDSTFDERVEGYRQRGYNVQFMTGIAWGNYQDYFTGKWDGKPHEEEEGQVERNGNHIGHGKGIPYIVPTDNFTAYFKTNIIKKVIDAGITTIYLEEPEFWARAGYSEAFKKSGKNTMVMLGCPSMNLRRLLIFHQNLNTIFILMHLKKCFYMRNCMVKVKA